MVRMFARRGMDDRATAESFVGSDDLRQTMTRAGFVRVPDLWLTNQA